MKWTEISDSPHTKRFELLSEELKLSGIENSFVATELPVEFRDPGFFSNEEGCDQFRNFVNQFKLKYDQIRVGGFFRENIDLFSHEYPAELMQIRVLDSLVKSQDRWWPRNQQFHAFISVMIHEIKKFDFSAPILVVGANADSKTMISALIKLGFSHFNITDINSEKSRNLVSELKRCYFSSRFEVTEIGYVTQLSNIFSIGVNGISGDLDETTRMAVIYFNFLIKDGLWIESSARATSVLADEAKTFGFSVWSGIDMISNLDFIWAQSVLKGNIDLARLKESYSQKLF